jgi:hypothetical protein
VEGGIMSEICHQVASAITVILQSQTLPNSPTVVSGITAEINDEESARVIVIGDSSTLYKPSLPGLFSVNGTVIVVQSIDSTNAETKFNDICQAIEGIIGMKYQMPSLIHTVDSSLKIFTYNMAGSTPSIGKRHFMARFSFDCIASNSPITTT